MASTQSLDDLNAGRAALDAGDWQTARRAFERGLAVEETPEALEGLGLAAWWLDLADVVFDARERAYRAYRESRRPNAAAASGGVACLGQRGVSRRSGGGQRVARSAPAACSRGSPISPEHAFLAERAAVFALLDEGEPGGSGEARREAIRSARRSAPSITRWSAARSTVSRG